MTRTEELGKHVRALARQLDNKNLAKLQDWTQRNWDNFEHAMDMLLEERPADYVRYFLQIQKDAFPEQPKVNKVADTINVNNTQINKLDAAAELTDTSWRTNNPNLSDYEEVK